MMEGMNLQKLIKKYNLVEGDVVICDSTCIVYFTEGSDYVLEKCLGMLGVNNSLGGCLNKFIVKEKTPHCELKHLWADGAIIQVKSTEGIFNDCGRNCPSWEPTLKYRVKPREYSDTEILEWMWKTKAHLNTDGVEFWVIIHLPNGNSFKSEGYKNEREAINVAMNQKELSK